ncbi:Eco57I restriction-modification methylase domain-containing protein [Prochlorothrix hollandica]|uniref:Eco57I restriction-modification methylase domain-containing protein n=1 Tax=Prochlorothrix hollandica TaxID=1223 RepID=UPI0011D18D4F|nr:Eco57I restriction-modification methylase domain-containing protein [Prochlorothrix hollandica]
MQRPFDEAQFRQLAQNLVNDLDGSKTFTLQGQYIKDAYKNQVRQQKRIGQYVDPEGNTIDILVVRLHQPMSLDRARTMQRNFIAQYLQDRGQKEAALVAYYTDGSTDWRFSLVRLDYRLELQKDGTYKPKKEVTAARRSSFLVGETEPNHTAQQQLLPLLLNDRQNPTLDQLEAAFNIESVTREFFEQYKSLFLRLRDEIEALLATDPVIANDFTQKQIEPANFAKKLLGQTVFLYFLQKKGWLGLEPGQPWGSGPKDFLRRLLEPDQVPKVQYDNFFNDVLEPLFYQALAVDRGSAALYELPGCSQPCKIPFLNGGLFEPIGGYDWQTTNILIANETIAKILDTFDRYNFTVREDEPLDKEVAVDPEMLGKVFENLLEVSDRKSKGAFYTPREIVHYMCQESLINYLDTTINRQAVELVPPSVQQTSLLVTPPSGQMLLTQEDYCERVPRGDLERLIRQGERAIENDAQVVQKGTETSTYQFRVPQSVRTYAADLDRALAAIRICDPAIGSGAFPVGMMQEIVKAREVLTTYLTLTPSPPTPLPSGERGAGSPQGEGRNAYAFKRHAIQSSIYGVDIDSGAVDIAKLRLWLSLVVDEENYESIKPLPNLDYKIVCGNSLLSVEKNLFNHQVFADLEQRKQEYFEETNAERKAALRTAINTLIQTITNQDQTFDFEVYFSEVLQQRGGFDVVIGNPPYVRQEQIKHLKDDLKKQYECFTGTADLYVFFYEQGLKLLREQGVLTYISSNKWFRAAYGKKLRQFITSQTQLQQIIDFGDAPVFAAIAYPTIVITQKGKPEAQSFQALNWEKGQSISQFETVVQSQSFTMPQTALTAEGWQFADATVLNLLEKLRKAGTPLGEYVNNRFYRGVVTGFNEAFVVDRATRDKLIAEHPSSAEVLKPFLRGRDVKRWTVDYADLWLLFIPWHFPLHNDSTIEGVSEKAEKAFKQQYPAIYNHLLNYKTELSNRNKAETGIRYEWYALQRCAATYWQEFERSKIILGRFMDKPTFAFDRAQFFHNDALYMISGVTEYVVAVLNSSISWWFLRQICTDLQNGYLQAFRKDLFQIPIPPASAQDKAVIETLVDYVLYLTTQLKDIPSHGKHLRTVADDKLMRSYFEQIVDVVVMELYLPEELHTHNKYFMRYLLQENLPSLDELKDNKMASLRLIFQRLFDRKHPIREGIFFLDSVPVVRIIRGLK